MIDKTLLLIIVLCLLMLPVYFRTKKFTSPWGIILFTLAFSALFLRLSALNLYPVLAIFNSQTLIQSALVISGPAIVFSFFGVISNHFRRRLKRLEKLIIPYFLFGAMQQLFFYWIFTDTIYYLINNTILVFIISFSYFVIFHLSKGSSIKKFWFLLILFSLIDTYIYLVWQNIIPQMLVHGIVGSILFTEFTEHDEIKDRLG